MMRKELLRVEDLTTHFYTEEGIVKALDGVSFSIEEGEIMGLVGETGCGKSVTATSIMRLIPSPPGRIVSGRVFFEGRNLLELSEAEMRSVRGKEIAMIFQDPMSSLNPVLKVGFQVLEAIITHSRVTVEEGMRRVKEIFGRVNIPDVDESVSKYPHQFSGGMRQRVMIAMALSMQPKLLIADEPTTALDVSIQAQILSLIKRLQREFSTSVLLISHDLGVIATMAQKVGVMYAGSIIEYGSVKEIFNNPLHPYTKGLLNAIPRLDSEKEWLEVIPGSVPNLLYPPPGCRFHPRCPVAKDVCMQEKPRLIEVEKGHMVACHEYSRG